MTKRERFAKLAAKIEAKLAAGKGRKRAYLKAKLAQLKARIAEME